MPPTRLSPEDAAILKLEHGPIAGHTCKILVIDPGPDGGALPAEALRDHVTARLDRAPRLRQRIAPTPLGLAPPLWVDHASFTLANHVRAVDVAAPLDDSGLQTLVGRLMSERLDRERPLWSLHVAPLTGGRTALVFKLHHAMADGMTAIRLAASVLWDTERDPSPPVAVPWTPGAPYGPLGLVGLALTERIRGGAATVAGVAAALRSPGRWGPAWRGASQLPATVRRELRPLAAASPLAAAVGAERRIAWTSTSLESVHRAAKAVGDHVTINDVVLASVAGGVRAWLAAEHAHVGQMRVKVPVSLHRPDEPASAANRDGFMFVDLPVDEPDSVARVLAVNAETLERKQAHDAERLDALLRDISHVPVVRRAARLTMSPREFTLCVSNVPGPREPLYVLGRRLRALHSVAEVAPGHAVRLAAVTASGMLSFGVCADPEVVQDLDRLAAGIADSLDDLVGRTNAR